MSKISIRRQLTIRFVLVSFIGTILVASYITTMSFLATKGKITQSNEQIVNQVSYTVERFVQLGIDNVKALALNEDVKSMDVLKLQPYLQKVFEQSSDYSLMYVMNTNGDQIWKSSGTLANRSDREYFKQAVGGNVFTTDIYISAGNPIPCITISSPIYRDNVIVGVIAADLSLSYITDLVNSIKIGKNGYIDVVGKDLNLLLSSSESVEEKMKQSGDKQWEISLADTSYASYAIAKEGSMQSEDSNGNEALISFSPVKSLNCAIISYYPISELHQENLKTAVRSLVGALIVMFISWILGVYTAKKFTKPLLKISDVIKKVASYDLNIGNDSEFAKLHSNKNEIGDMSIELGKMIDMLEKLISEISLHSKETAQTANRLAQAAQKASISANDASTAVESIAQGATDQAQDVQNVVTSMDVSNRNLNDMFTTLDNLSEATDGIILSKNEGNASLNELISVTKENDKATKLIKDTIIQTNDSAEKISNAGEMIQSISDQTNLLALNAAIEAARAGEAGKGFAVVAEEIRKLAEQSAGFTDDIKKTIDELREKTNNAVKTMQDLEKTSKTQDEKIKNTESKFEKIEGAIDQIQLIDNILKDTSKKIESENKNIISAVENLSAISEESAAATQEASASMESQAQLVSNISRASENLSNIAANLQEEVSKFTL